MAIVQGSADLALEIPAGDNVIGRVQISNSGGVADTIDLGTYVGLGVIILDGSGNPISSFGGGTQYTEDAAAAANPVGNAVILIRDDLPGAQVTTEGDNVAQRGTDFGAAYVQVVTSAGAFVDTFGGGEQHATNEAYTDTDVGTVALVVRDDALAALTEADADYSVLRVTSTGRLWASVVIDTALPAGTANIGDVDILTIAAGDNNIGNVDIASIAAGDNNIGNVDIVTMPNVVIGSGTVTTVTTVTTVSTVSALGVSTTGPQKAISVASAAGDMGIAAFAIRDDTLNIRSDVEGDWEPLHTNANGALWTIGVDEATQTASLALIDDTVYVDDTATHATGTSKVIGIGAAAVPTDTSISANDIGMVGMTTDRRLYTEATIAATQTLSTVTTVGTVTTLTGGGIAHDSGDSGNPHKIGGKAIDIATQPTAVTANDRTDWYFNRNGVPFFLGGSPATLTKELDVTDADGAQTDAALVTVSAGTAIIVTAFQAMADHANTVDVGFRCGFGTANTPAADAAGIIASHPGVAAGSGVVVGTGAGIIGMGASDQDLRVTCEDPVTGAIRFIVTYHTVLIG